jgi:hypothetical protein
VAEREPARVWFDRLRWTCWIGLPVGCALLVARFALPAGSERTAADVLGAILALGGLGAGVVAYALRRGH